MNEAQQRILGNVARALYELGDIFDEAALNLGLATSRRLSRRSRTFAHGGGTSHGARCLTSLLRLSLVAQGAGAGCLDGKELNG